MPTGSQRQTRHVDDEVLRARLGRQTLRGLLGRQSGQRNRPKLRHVQNAPLVELVTDCGAGSASRKSSSRSVSSSVRSMQRCSRPRRRRGRCRGSMPPRTASAAVESIGCCALAARSRRSRSSISGARALELANFERSAGSCRRLSVGLAGHVSAGRSASSSPSSRALVAG